jgi:flagellar biosynthesis protein
MQSSKQAIALRYDFQSDRAPRIIAKGSGNEADLMEDIARNANIPIKQDQGLIKLLDNVPLYEEIPDLLYEIIAVIYVDLQKIANTSNPAS